MTEILASVGTLLLVSVGLNVYLLRARARLSMDWLKRETQILDRAHAAELRSHQQIDLMLDRISTSPTLELAEHVEQPRPDPSVQKYVSDEPYMDEVWDTLREGEALTDAG